MSLSLVSLPLFLLTVFLSSRCSSQRPSFPPQFEGTFTEFITRRVQGRDVDYFEVGTEYVDRTRNLSRFEVVAYEDVDGTQVAFPQQRIHQPSRTYNLRDRNSDGSFECTYGSSSAPPDPTKLTWAYSGSTFVQPDARHSQETVWGTHTVDVFEANTTTSRGTPIQLTYGEDSFTKRPVLFGMDSADFRSLRAYRFVRVGAPSRYDFAIPYYFKCTSQ